MRWLNTLRRWLGRPERPPATSAETSVLFVLSSHSPMDLSGLCAETWIAESEILDVLRKLEAAGRIRITYAGLPSKISRLYWMV